MDSGESGHSKEEFYHLGKKPSTKLCKHHIVFFLSLFLIPKQEWQEKKKLFTCLGGFLSQKKKKSQMQ